MPEVVSPAVTNPAPVNSDTSQAAPSAPVSPGTQAKTFKLKVDGADLELSEAEVISLAQQGKSAGKRFQEAAATKREAEQIVNYLKSNPKEAFKKLGIDVRKFSEDTLMEMINQEKMSPAEKKAFENEKRLKEYEKGEKATKDKEHADNMAKLERQHMENYDQVFTAALGTQGLPKTAYTIKRMAELTMVNNRKKLDLSPDQLAKVVREDYIAEQRVLFEHSDGDALLSMLGKEALKKISKAQLSKYKGRSAVPIAKKPSESNGEKGADPIAAWKAFKKQNRSF